MKFKEYVEWCNQRACDGYWGIDTAILCIEIYNRINKQPFWRREREWQRINTETKIVEKVVNPINKKIAELSTYLHSPQAKQSTQKE